MYFIYIYKLCDLLCCYFVCFVCYFYIVICYVLVDVEWVGFVYRMSVGNLGNIVKFWVLGFVFWG